MLLLAVTYSSKIPARTTRVGYDAELAGDVLIEYPIISDKDPRRRDALLSPDENQSRALISTVAFQSAARDVEWSKPAFLFGDDMATNEAGMETDAFRWVREVDGERYFLPPRPGQYSLARLSRRALPRRADWALTHIAYGVVTGELVHGGAAPRPHHEMLGLRPGSLCAELSENDNAVQARAFMN